jgi:hypothetical protein
MILFARTWLARQALFRAFRTGFVCARKPGPLAHAFALRAFGAKKHHALLALRKPPRLLYSAANVQSFDLE